MAIDPVDAFLAEKPTFLSGLDRSIKSNKDARRAAMMANRGQQTAQRGLGAMRASGAGGGLDPRGFLNPQSVGAQVPGGGAGRLALPPGGGGGVPARVMAGGQAAGGGGQLALGAGPAGIGPGPAGLPPGATSPTQNIGRISHTPTRPGGLPPGAQVAGSAVDDLAVQGLGAGSRATAGGAGGPTGALGRKAVTGAGYGPVNPAQALTTGAKGLKDGQGLAKLFSGVTAKSMMSGAGVAGTGYMLSGIIDGMDIGGENNAFDRAGSGAVLGGGLAAGGAIALGLGSGPVGWAALGGASLFAGYKTLFGEKRSTPEQMQDIAGDTRDTIENIASMYGLDPAATEDIMMQYDASTSLMIDQKDKDGLKNYLTGLTNQLPAMMLQQKEEQDAQGQQDKRFERMMQMQAQFAPMFERQMQTANASSERAYQQQMSVSDVLVDRQPQLAALIKTQAADDNAAQARLMTAYGKQVALGPGTAYNQADLEQRLQQQALLDQAMQQ